MNCGNCSKQTDNGPAPYAANIERMTMRNDKFRTAVWTGCHLQMTIMCIPPCGEIGLEFHKDTDQFIRVEQGRAIVKMGKCKEQLDFQRNLCRGDAVFIPAGTWHNIVNAERKCLKVSSIYAPPNHPKGTVQRTKTDAQREEYEVDEWVSKSSYAAAEWQED
ncbi:MAG: cupin domain-containing protein [Lachnospiraceae bacterium]|nr:cupin domain-containing protein [Lachnospiraceae bacterium]